VVIESARSVDAVGLGDLSDLAPCRLGPLSQFSLTTFKSAALAPRRWRQCLPLRQPAPAKLVKLADHVGG